jgi:hypothetical protein
MAPIRQILKQLLGKAYREQLKMEADTLTYLSTLPTCHRFVLIAAPEYGEGEYNCGITVPAIKLLTLYREEIERTTIFSQDSKVRRRTLSLWLEQASTNDGEVTSLPRDAFRDIRGSIPDWVKADKAPVWCYSCENWVTGITMTKENESQIGNLIFVWTDLWYCSRGHKLHEATQEIRRFFAKAKVSPNPSYL